MLRDNKKTVLLIALGMNTIEFAVATQRGSQLDWLEESCLIVEIQADQGSSSALQNAIFAFEEAYQFFSALKVNIAEIRVGVAEGWLAIATMPWSSLVKKAHTAQSFARSYFDHYGYEVQSDDLIKIDDRPFENARLIVAYPHELLAALNRFAHQFTAQLTSVLPISVLAWRLISTTHRTQSRVLALIDDQTIEFLYNSNDLSYLDSVITRTYVQGEFNPQLLMNHWQRMCLRQPQLATNQALILFDLTQSVNSASLDDYSPFIAANRVKMNEPAIPLKLQLLANNSALPSTLDAITTRHQFKSWQAIVLAILVTLALLFVFHTIMIHQRINDLQTRLITTAPVQETQSAPDPLTKDEIAQVSVVNIAIHQLNLPILSILDALQPPKTIQTALLSVETTNNTKLQPYSIKIAAEARTSEDMARYVRFLAMNPLFSNVYLTQHELDMTSPEQPYLFTVEALWGQ